MRTTAAVLAISAVILLLVASSGLALAQGSTAEDRRAAQEARRDELKASRATILEQFKANRTTIIAEYHEALNATKVAFMAHKADVQASCNATRQQSTGNADNESGMPEHAQCMREGLAPYIQEARASNQAARENARASLVEARAHGMSEWAKSLREANARHAPDGRQTPSGG